MVDGFGIKTDAIRLHWEGNPSEIDMAVWLTETAESNQNRNAKFI